MRYGGLIAAVVFAAIAAIVVMQMSGNQTRTVGTPPVAVEQKTTNVYIATKPIAIGNTITAEDVASQAWPSHLVLDGFVMADEKTNIIGMVARAPFQQNEPIISTKLANPNDPNFLAGELPKGMRVITIPINETDGVAGFVFPGDHVDVIFTHNVDKWVDAPNGTPRSSSGGGFSSFASSNSGPEKITQTITETLLTNVKVLAIDQRSSNAGAVDKTGALIVPRSASVMVSQSDAQRVRLASKTGTLSLVLRALADKESADPLILTTSKDITQDPSHEGKDADKVKVIRGAPKEQVSLTDVLLGASKATSAPAQPTSNPTQPSGLIGAQ